jgi:DNA-binding MarR family transcriptional regulator
MQDDISPDFDAQLFEAFADLDRLRILDYLRDGPATQKEIAAGLTINSGTLSRHMATLAAAGLVARGRSHSPFELAASKTADMLALATEINLEVTQTKQEALQRRRAKLKRAPARRATVTEIGSNRSSKPGAKARGG